MPIQSIERATDIMSLFSSAHTFLGIAEIAAALNLNKGTVWGLVSTLEQRRFLQQDPATRKYTVGPKLFELGMIYVSGLEINARASRPVQKLASRTGLSARVGIWESSTVLITFFALPKAKDSLSYQVGPRVPGYCSGIGKALLAYLQPAELDHYCQHAQLVRHTPATIVSQELLRKDLERTRKRGYSISREEMILGLAALGAPVFGRKQGLVGAISISESPRIVLGDRMEELADELLCTASEISHEMGYGNL